MSIESSPIAPRGADPTVLPPASPNEPQGLADRALAPLDHFHDSLVRDVGQLDQELEAKTAHVPLLGQLMQFASGAGGALGGMVDSTYEMLRHPIATVKSFWAMATHIPLTPMWFARALTGGFGSTLREDRTFWGTVIGDMIAPYRKDLAAHRYFAVAGRAAVDIGTLYIGVRQAQRAVQAWHANREAAMVRAGQAPEAGLKATLVGDDQMASGQALGEGVTTHGLTGSPGERMVSKIKARNNVVEQGLPATESTREQLGAAAKRFAGDRGAIRRQAVLQLRWDKQRFMYLRQVGPERLATDPMVRQRFRLLTSSVEDRMSKEIQDLLGVYPSGTPKNYLRAASKLEKLQADGGNAIRLGNLEDLARGRINLPSFDVTTMRGMLHKLEAHYGRDNLIIHDYMTGKPFYRGRLHVKVRDGSGMWYELQIGPKQLSTFYDTPFQIAGKSVCIHDAVYKGLMRLDDTAIKAVGRGDMAAGRARLAHVLDMYVDNVNQVVSMAKKGQTYDFALSKELRGSIRSVVEDIPKAELPLGLQAG